MTSPLAKRVLDKLAKKSKFKDWKAFKKQLGKSSGKYLILKELDKDIVAGIECAVSLALTEARKEHLRWLEKYCKKRIVFLKKMEKKAKGWGENPWIERASIVELNDLLSAAKKEEKR